VGHPVSPSTVSDLNKKIYGTIEAWRNRPIVWAIIAQHWETALPEAFGHYPDRAHQV
jgi:hypothetical protein